MPSPLKKPAAKQSVLAQLSELERLGLPELRVRWREVFGTDVPGYSAEHLRRRIAYRIQEVAHGGLSPDTRARLASLADVAQNGEVAPLRRKKADNGLPVPGTRLIREWNGSRYEVVVTPGGYELDGRPYRSLSAVAKAITGQHWNGPLFFGLKKRKKSS
jgi:hypothetical protein